MSLSHNKYQLLDLPEPAPASVVASFAHDTNITPSIDLWDGFYGQRLHKRIDTAALYQPMFECQAPQFNLEHIREWIAPLPHRIRNQLMRDYDVIGKHQGKSIAMVQLRKKLQLLLKVWHSYPFHDLPYLSAVRGDENDDEAIKAAPQYSAPRYRAPVSTATYFDFINGDVDQKDTTTLPALSLTSPFRGYEFLRQRKSKRLDSIASNIANAIMARVKQVAYTTTEDVFFVAYDAAASLCQQWGVIPPYWGPVKRDQLIAAAECGILRMTCPKWWKRQLSKLRDCCCEHMNIAAGLVNISRPYVSEEAFQEWVTQQKSAMNWLENTVIENDDGVILPLIEAAMAGNANPSNRLVELIVRARGLEEMAESAGMVGFMITLTCPSKFHKHSHKYAGTSPRDAQKYLVKQFAKIRSALSYRKIDMTGMRVAEPHKDGTPHWHLLCFVQPHHVADLKHFFQKYAYELDPNEPGAKQHRLKVESIDKTKGSAVGYVIKYISKNIQGEFMQGELDFETGKSVADGAKFARAWASRHHLRQFQFYGTSSVQIWRELRRIKEGPQSPEIETAKAAACSSDWFAFEKAMAAAQLKLTYDITECGNEYGEAVTRIQGIEGLAFGQVRTIVTRGENWRLRNATDAEQEAYQTLKQRRSDLFASERLKPEAERLSRSELKSMMPKWSVRLLKDGDSRPWTCRNNCTDPALDEIPHRVISHLQQIGITDSRTIDRLINQGQRIIGTGGDEWWIDNGCLRTAPYRYAKTDGKSLGELMAEMVEWNSHEHITAWQ